MTDVVGNIGARRNLVHQHSVVADIAFAGRAGDAVEYRARR